MAISPSVFVVLGGFIMNQKYNQITQNNQGHLTASKILEMTMEQIAPLPSQRGYAAALAGILSVHIHRNQLIDDGIPADQLPAPSAMVVAPTGQGKTFLVRKMAEAVGLHTIIIDCSTRSAEGWRGISLSQRLVRAMSDLNDERKFMKSLIFFDEVDKLKRWGTTNDQGNAMQNILQLYNGGKIALEVTKDRIVNVDVGRFTILLGGAFEGLDEIIRKRIGGKNKIGFCNGDDAGKPKLTTGQLLQQVTLADLEQFGMMMEVLGRVGTVLSIPPLEVADYRQLLRAENGSIWQRYNNYLKNLYGVQFEITDAGVEQIATKCMNSTTGARAVNPFVNDLMRVAITSVENNDEICRVILDAADGACVIRCEEGHREYAFRDPAREKELMGMKRHVLRAKNLAAMTNKLIRYYRNAGGNSEFLSELEAYLDCAIVYLGTKCQPKDFTFDSLEKLARSTVRGSKSSPFEIILNDAGYAVTKERIKRFTDLYMPRTPQRLTYALQMIMTYIRKWHGDCRVVFEIKKQNL